MLEFVPIVRQNRYDLRWKELNLAIGPEENQTPFRLKSSSIPPPVPIEIAPKSLKNRDKSKAIGRREFHIPVLAPHGDHFGRKRTSGGPKRNWNILMLKLRSSFLSGKWCDWNISLKVLVDPRGVSVGENIGSVYASVDLTKITRFLFRREIPHLRVTFLRKSALSPHLAKWPLNFARLIWVPKPCQRVGA